MQRQIVILAAGKGSRMKSNLPKVMHKIGDKTMLQMVVDNAYAVTKDIILVYSDHIAEYLSAFANQCKFALQNEQLGTAHAVWVASALINKPLLMIAKLQRYQLPSSCGIQYHRCPQRLLQIFDILQHHRSLLS